MAIVKVFNSGPLRTEGDFEMVDANGATFGFAGRKAIGLCRCGLSDNKPFCEGAHARQGFDSVCEARELPPPKSKV